MRFFRRSRRVSPDNDSSTNFDAVRLPRGGMPSTYYCKPRFFPLERYVEDIMSNPVDDMEDVGVVRRKTLGLFNKRYEYDNGYVYKGDWDIENNRPHGNGVLYNRYESVEFEGSWCKGKKSWGTYRLGDGAVYIGGFANSKFSGMGQLCVFVGDNGRDGEVEMYRMYRGKWKNGKMNDSRGVSYKDNEKYREGQWMDGTRRGVGKYHVWGRRKPRLTLNIPQKKLNLLILQ